MTQPYTGTSGYKAEIEVSHVKFLQSGGARVVPVDYRLSKSSLTTLLKQLDGIYIPGDAAEVLSNTAFLNTVYNIISFGQSIRKGGHFPIVAISYGLAAAIKCQKSRSTTITTLPPTL